MTLGLSDLYKPTAIEAISKSFSTLAPEVSKRIVQGTILSNSYFKGLQLGDLATSFATVADNQNIISFGVQSSLIKATELNLFAEKSLSAFKWSNVGNIINIDKSQKNLLQKSFLDFSTNYSKLLKVYENQTPKWLTSNPNFLKLPSLEYFTSSNLLEAITVEEDVTSEEEIIKTDIQSENEYSLTSWLPKIDKGLIKMWQGAIEAFSSNNPERVRHFVTSIRELFTHVLHLLATDEQIKTWSKSESDYSNGRPTRKARLRFICRNIADAPFTKFVEKDIEATIAFIDLFQKGTHAIDPKFSENHLVTIKSKAETTLRFILEIHFSTNN